MSFFQLDRDILTSSIWAQGSPEAIKVWVYMLLSANPRTGIVEDAAPAIALRNGLSLEATKAALEWLQAPDAESRTKEYDGRRIEKIEGGWRLLNYLKRQDKDHSTQRVRSWRERKRAETVGNGTKRRETASGTKDKDKDKDTSDELTTEVPEAAPPVLTRLVKELSEATAPPLPGKPKKPSWSKDACDDWIARFDGVAPGGAIGRLLKPLVDRHGWDVVRASWRAYLEQTEPEFASPAGFAQKFGQYRKAPAPPAPPPEEPLPPADAAAFHFFEAMKVRLAGVVSQNSHATWIRPVWGRAWEESKGGGKVLVLTVPSNQFRDQLRGVFADRLRGAAAEMGVPGCLFRIVVVKDEAVLHDGSVR